MRTAIKWILLVFAAVVVAGIPTRLSDHDNAIGFPFTWHTSQQIITLGEQPHSFSFLLLLCDFAVALLVLATAVKVVRPKRT